MRRSSHLLLPFLCLALTHWQTVRAHYRFTTLYTPHNGLKSTSAVRYPILLDPIMDVTSPDMRCSFQGQIRPATSTFEVEAGREVGWGLDHVIFHPGPAAVYLGRPEGGEVKLQDWDGSGKAWFKIKDFGGVYDPVMWNFEILNKSMIYTTIPATTPPGEYLLRAEQIGLLIPFEPQYYVSCAQIRVVAPVKDTSNTSGTVGTPSPLVEIPGHYAADDPGLLLDIYNPVEGEVYRVPGPDPWVG